MSQPSDSADPAESAAMAAEEYRVWKKNTPYLYDFVLSHALEWPSLTVDWVPPSSTTSSSAAANSHRLLLGTHTSDSSPNFLMLAGVSFPSPPSDSSSPPRPLPAVTIDRKAPHTGEVNRARHMPQKPNLVATKTCGSEVHVFDLGKEEKEIGGPEAVLRGHEMEGYGVDWSTVKEGWLISGGYDSKICFWDVGGSGGGKVLDALQVFEVMPVSNSISCYPCYVQEKLSLGNISRESCHFRCLTILSKYGTPI